MSELQKDSENSFAKEYRKDKRREGFLNIGLGVLIILLTIFDVAFSFMEELWYFDFFFGLLGIILLVYGIIQIRAHPNDQK